MAATKNKVEGGILASVHKTAASLATLREFDALCLTLIEPLTPKEWAIVRAAQSREG